jgi:4-hydroxy-3-polyprenylbenzoate decarboxylase
MPFRDLREFISKLISCGQAQVIHDEVDWNMEAGAMVRIAGEKDLPAPFFQRIKDYPSGYKLFGGTLSNYKRMAIAMDMDPDTSAKELMEEYNKRKLKPIKPKVVNEGPCKENIHIGDEVDLLEFPVPMIHEVDGGRFIGTWHLTISKNSETGWVNWGMYRHMLHNKNSIGIQLTSPRKHLWTIYDKSAQSQKGRMDVAIAIGVEPISTLCAGTPLETEISEVDIAGGLRGEPIELIQCETVDLMVPATSEIVIEGEFRADVTMDEGPFGEYTGYSSSPKSPKPTIHVKAITHRNDPIFTMSCLGVPLDDNLIWCLTKSAAFLEILRKRGLPVTAVNASLESSSLITVVSTKASYFGIAADIAHLLWGVDAAHASPYIIVVEDDVDVFNLNQVFHTLATRCHPSRGIVRAQGVPVTPLLPFLNPDERKHRIGAMAYFDCTWPLDWGLDDIPKRISFADVYPKEIQQRVLEMWHKYGFDLKT